MAVVDGSVSFEALSTVISARQFTDLVGIQPTSAVEVGDLVGNGRRGRRAQVALWSLVREFGGGRNPLDSALSELLTEFVGREALLDAARVACELRVRCWGSSNSEQGGFWLSSEVISRLGRLAVEFHCTVYLQPQDEPA